MASEEGDTWGIGLTLLELVMGNDIDPLVLIHAWNQSPSDYAKSIESLIADFLIAFQSTSEERAQLANFLAHCLAINPNMRKRPSWTSFWIQAPIKTKDSFDGFTGKIIN